jgi:hypothetical protein
MQVYREQRRQDHTGPLLAGLHAQLASLAPRHEGAHDRVVRLLIDLGVFESGLADAIHEHADDMHPVTGALRGASLAAGHLLWHVWHGHPEGIEPWAARASAALAIVEQASLPTVIDTTVPEGYAHYGLYPESYLLAAKRAARELSVSRAVCIGIRSIGTSLSGVVGAALQELGWEILSLTVRPRGHPFGRRTRFAPALTAALRERVSDVFLLVDEGPGLSGSSLAGTARALVELGVSDDRIVLLPSWRTDGTSLRSAEARERWRRHRQFTVTFEESWVESGRLGTIAPDPRLRDISAGAWRPLLLEGPADWPPVQPQHERRKFLAGGSPALLLRFAGLGRYGDGKLERAKALANAGFSPPPLGLEHGFLLQEFCPGTPASADPTAATLVERMANYLAYLRRCHPASSATATDLTEMLRTNVREALGDAAAGRLARRLRAEHPFQREPPTAIDGRMLPYEWLSTVQGYRKTDALDHGDDHFYPGPQDIAWDIAGTCVEFGLAGGARSAFVERYRRASGDRCIAGRLPLYALAYLAFRLGYATLAAESLSGTPDGNRFRVQAARYRRLLEAELGGDEAAAAARWRG